MQILTPIELLAPSSTAPPAPPQPSAPGEQLPPRRTAPPIAGKVFLPDGTPLLMSISRKVVLGALFDVEELDDEGKPTGLMIPWGGPASPMEDIVVLFLCATPPSVWYQPVLCDDGAVRMLYQDPRSFMAAANDWADSTCLKEMTLGELYPIVEALWKGAHANFATPLAEKKTESPPMEESPPTGATNTPPSSPEETQVASPS